MAPVRRRAHDRYRVREQPGRAALEFHQFVRVGEAPIADGFTDGFAAQQEARPSFTGFERAREIGEGNRRGQHNQNPANNSHASHRAFSFAPHHTAAL